MSKLYEKIVKTETVVEKGFSLICPVCQEPLAWGNRSCVCEQGHSFDLAKEGYVNLLLSNCRRSKNPGDSVDMVKARRRFFDTGAFSQVAEHLQNEVRELLSNMEPQGGIEIVDLGCGEGYFLGELGKIVKCSSYGLDASKEAIRVAARRYRNGRWIVANIMRKIPFASDSIDIILSVLAPRKVEEFARVLKVNGRLVIVVPGKNHLTELNSRLMAEAGNSQDKAEAAINLCASHLINEQRKSLRFELPLNRNQISDLVQMTPLFWHSTREAKAKLELLDELKVTMDFTILSFSLKP